MTLKGINSKLETIYNQKEALESRFLEEEAQKKQREKEITSLTQAIMRVKNLIQRTMKIGQGEIITNS